MVLQNYVPSPRTWVVHEAFVNFLSPIMIGCVLNQS
jgi:hypothetical protein